MAFYESRWFAILKNFLIGVGAAFIIIGALFKIMHWPGANEILILAMSGEAAIFLLQALIPPHKDYHWENLFPGLDQHNAKVEPLKINGVGGGGAKAPNVTEQLNKELSKAGVNQDLIKRLGSHLGTLGQNLSSLTQVTSVAGATGEYTKQAQAAAKALGKVKVAYENASTVAGDLAIASENTKKYQQQVQAVSKNLAALNAVYELELQDTNNHLKAINKFYGNLTNAIDNLNGSVEDTKKYRQQMANLANNLSSLNTIYGNMLSAMSMGARKK